MAKAKSTKKTVLRSKSTVSSKKQKLTFKPWQAFVAMAVVALAGWGVVRFSQAATPYCTLSITGSSSSGYLANWANYNYFGASLSAQLVNTTTGNTVALPFSASGSRAISPLTNGTTGYRYTVFNNGAATTISCTARVTTGTTPPPPPPAGTGFSHGVNQLTGGVLSTKYDGTTYRVAKVGESIATSVTLAEVTNISNVCVHVKVLSAVSGLWLGAGSGQQGGGIDKGAFAPGMYDVCMDGHPTVAATINIEPIGKGSIAVDRIYSK